MSDRDEARILVVGLFRDIQGQMLYGYAFDENGPFEFCLQNTPSTEDG